MSTDQQLITHCVSVPLSNRIFLLTSEGSIYEFLYSIDDAHGSRSLDDPDSLQTQLVEHQRALPPSIVSNALSLVSPSLAAEVDRILPRLLFGSASDPIGWFFPVLKCA